MARNVEIQARARNFERQSQLASALGGGAVERMVVAVKTLTGGAGIVKNYGTGRTVTLVPLSW